MCALEPNRIGCAYKIKQSFVSSKTSATLKYYGDDISNVLLKKGYIKIKYSQAYEATRSIFSVSSFLYL